MFGFARMAATKSRGSSVPQALGSNTFRHTLGPHGTVDVGDAASGDCLPHAKIGKWAGEVFLSVALLGMPVQTPAESGGQMRWTDTTRDVRLYPLPSDAQNEDGAFEFDILLKSAPASNVLTLAITTDNLTFHYQPELTAEEIANGAVRPTNVVGSYAVYHATRGQLHASQEDADRYKTGKAYHIYRPELIDAAGNRSWADIAVDAPGGTLTITMPQAFLDTAVYPVQIDPTFGYTTQGSSSNGYSGNTTNYFQLNALSPAGTNTLTNLSLCVGGGAGSNWRYAFYSETASEPSTRRARDASTWQGPVSKNFYTNPVAWSFALTAATQYWGAAWTDASGDYYFDTSGAYNTRYASGSDTPDPATSSADYSSVIPSAYATYTAGGGAVTATLTQTIGAITEASTATVLDRATLAKTLATVTIAATSKVLDTGSLTQTLGTITIAATATVGGEVISATLAQTLGAITETATATVADVATLSQTLGTITATSTATVSDTATLTQTLAAITTTATGTVVVSAGVQQTLADAGLAAAATVLDTAALGQTLGGISLAATGETTGAAHATLSQTLGPVTLTAAGDVAIAGEVDVLLASVTTSGVGDVAIAAEVDALLASITLTATAQASPYYRPQRNVLFDGSELVCRS